MREDSTAHAYPERTWERLQPEEADLSTAGLAAMSDYLGGRGCVVRHGYLVHTWGDWTARGDIASAVKPWYTHFLFEALEDDLITDLDEPLSRWEPRLSDLNASLDCKDRRITWRHVANQTSCYGVREEPGTAFDYNDYQMALFWDALFLEVYQSALDTVDDDLLRPKLTDPLQCEDDPTFMAFGTGDRAGRLAISPRDHARFGLLYLRRGLWRGQRLIPPEHVARATGDPLPLSIPRTRAEAADMIPGQRTIGSQVIPDDQTDHHGSYSWLWWVNGIGREGRRFWPDAPADAFAALGHNGRRGVAVVPSLDLVMSWNDAVLDRKPEDQHLLNPAFRLLRAEN